MRSALALGDAYVGAAIMPPSSAGARQLSRSEICATAVPWDCAFGWVPLLGAPWALSTRCREAYEVEKACNAGAYNPNLVPGSGAGAAPVIAAQPGVNYNDPKVLQEIAEGQKRNDLTAWLASISSNLRLMGGDGSKPEAEEPGMNFMILMALAIVIGGALLAKR